MSIRDILLFLDDGKSNAARVKVAISIAQIKGASLTGVALGSMKPVHAPEHDEKAIARMGERMAERLTEDFVATAKDAGIEASTLIIFGDSGSSAEKMAHYARNYDLVITSQPDPAADNYDCLLELARQALILSGRPVLVVPYIGANKIPLKHIMIAWDGSPAVSRTVHDAIPLLKVAEDVLILVVTSKKQQETKKEVLVGGLVKHLQNHDIKARIHKVNPGRNSVSTVIQNEISQNDIDLLVIGGHGMPTLKQKIFGLVTANLLSSMVVPVIMSD